MGRLGKHQDAIDCFDKAIELDGKDQYLLVNKTYALSKLGKHEEALDFIDKAVETWNELADNFLNIKGIVLFELGKYDDAIDCFDKGIELDGKEPTYWSNKGEVLGVLGKYSDAIECYKKSLSIEENDQIRKELDVLSKLFS